MILTQFTYEYYEKLISFNGNLIRHDVDMSLVHAKKMAEIDYKNSIRSYFFIQLRSNFYNPNTKENYKIIKKIYELGHFIGLHFDITFYKIQNENELTNAIINESKMIPFCKNFFSFHINSDVTNKYKDDYGLVNIFNRNKNYISDSNHKPNNILNYLENNNDVQVNIHPEWWSRNYNTQYKKVKNIINKNKKNLIDEALRFYL